MFCKKGLLENFAGNFIEQVTQAQVFSCEFDKISQNTSERLLLPHKVCGLRIFSCRIIVLTKKNKKEPQLRYILLTPNLLIWGRLHISDSARTTKASKIVHDILRLI